MEILLLCWIAYEGYILFKKEGKKRYSILFSCLIAILLVSKNIMSNPEMFQLNLQNFISTSFSIAILTAIFSSIFIIVRLFDKSKNEKSVIEMMAKN